MFSGDDQDPVPDRAGHGHHRAADQGGQGADGQDCQTQEGGNCVFYVTQFVGEKCILVKLTKLSSQILFKKSWTPFGMSN